MSSKLLASIIYRLPFLTKFFLQGKGMIFMLHRVLPVEKRNEYDWNKGLAITPEGLEKWIVFFQKKGYDIVSMDEVEKRLGCKKTKKFVAFTIDDGYKDNLIYGLPVFEKYNVPFTLYVANTFPNKKAIYWWYFLESYIKSNSHIDLQSLGIPYAKTYSKSEELNIYNETRELLRKSTYDVHLRFANEICGVNNLDLLNDELNLTWEEVKELSNHQLVTIGGHTIHHVSLKNQTLEVIDTEVSKGTTELVDKIGKTIKHFAYPYGSLDDADIKCFDALRNSKYSTAVLNHPGSLFYSSDIYRYAIPRMGLTDETSEARINDLISGRLHLNFNGTKRSLL